VSLHITHTAVEELHISLVSPDGTSVNLSDDNGGVGRDYGTNCIDSARTVFADAALTSIVSGVPPYTGMFSPEEPLASVNGKFGAAINSAWRLVVQDDATGNVGTLQCWSLFIAPAVCSDGGGPCEQCRSPITGAVTGSDSIQIGRLMRNGIRSDCTTGKVCPDMFNFAPVHYDAYTFTNDGPDTCVTMSLAPVCGGVGQIFAVAYLRSFDPANICANYLGDIGSSSPDPLFCSFRVPTREVFVAVVHEVSADAGCTNYTLNMTGFECPQRIDIARDGANRMVLKWSTAAGLYQLERTNNLASSLSSWTPVLNSPVVINSRFYWTNTQAGTWEFFRLRKP
jgi:hypothetical protein